MFSGWDEETGKPTTRRAGPTRTRRPRPPRASAAASRPTVRTARAAAVQRQPRGRHARASPLRHPDPAPALRPLHAGDGRAGLRRLAGAVRARWPTRWWRTRAASARPPSSTPSAGPTTRRASSTSAPPRSCSCCSATSGRPGGGIMALRGHASIQGSTRHPDALQHPARLPADAGGGHARHAAGLPRGQRPRRPVSGATPASYFVSLLKAWWPDADAETAFGYSADVSPATTRTTRRSPTCATARSRATS